MTATPEQRDSVVAVNGIDLHVTDAGSGPPLLMIQGVTVDATFEQPEIAALAGRHRVIAPDLRGHGRSTRPAGFTLADHVQDMIGLLDALQVKQSRRRPSPRGAASAVGRARGPSRRLGPINGLERL